MKNSNSGMRKVEARTGVVFILPALFFYMVFRFLPMLGSLSFSFFKWEGFSFHTMEFIGFSNYEELMHDPVYLVAFKNTFVILFFAVFIQVTFALILALLLENDLPGSRVFRGIYFIPTVLSYVMVGLLFTLIFSTSLGLVNPMLKAMGLESLIRPWLGEKNSALAIVIIVHAWKNFGLSMFIFISGLSSIDQDLYASASISGANRWQKLIYITLPSIREVIAVVVVLASIEVFKNFDLVYVLTNGGPNHKTETMATWMYKQGFSYSNMGYGSSIAVTILIVALVITLLQLKFFRESKQ